MRITQEDVLRFHHEEFHRALRNGDLAALSDIYADEYMLVRPDGTAFSKQQILDDLKTHAMTVTSMSSTNERVRVYGSVGILTGDQEAVTRRDGKETTATVRFVAVYVEKNGELALAHFQSSPLQR